MSMFAQYQGGKDWLPAGTMAGIGRGSQMMWGGVKQGLDQLGAGIGEYGVKKKEKEWSDTIAEELQKRKAAKNKFRDEAAMNEGINDYLRGMKSGLGPDFAPGFKPTREGITQETADKVKEFWSLQDQLSATEFGREALQEGYAPDPSGGIGAAGRDEMATRWRSLRDELAPTGLIDRKPLDIARVVAEEKQRLNPPLSPTGSPWSLQGMQPEGGPGQSEESKETAWLRDSWDSLRKPWDSLWKPKAEPTPSKVLDGVDFGAFVRRNPFNLERPSEKKEEAEVSKPQPTSMPASEEAPPESSVMDRITDWASGDLERLTRDDPEVDAYTGQYGFPEDQRRILPSVRTSPSDIRRFDEMTRIDKQIAEGEARVKDLMAKDKVAQEQPIDMADVLRSALASGAAPDNKTFMDTIKEVGRLDEAASMREYREGVVSDKKSIAANKTRMANMDVSELLRTTIPAGGQPTDIPWSAAVEGVMKKVVAMGIEPDLAFRTRVEKRAKDMPFAGTESGRAQFKAGIKGAIEATKGPPNPMTGEYLFDPQSTAQKIFEDPALAARFPQLSTGAHAEAQKMFPSGVTLETVGANTTTGDPGQRIIKGPDGKYLGMAAAIPQRGSSIAIPILTANGAKTGKMFWGDKLVDDPEVTSEEKEAAKAETLKGREVRVLPPLKNVTDAGGNVVKMPEGVGSITGHAASPAEAKDMRERWSAAEEALEQFDILLAGTDSEGTGWELYGADRATADSAQAVLIGKLRIALLGPGQMTDAEAERIKTAIPNPREYGRLRSSTRAALLQTRASMMAAVKSAATAQGLTFIEGTKFDVTGAIDLASEVRAANTVVPTPGASSNVSPLMMQERVVRPSPGAFQ